MDRMMPFEHTQQQHIGRSISCDERWERSGTEGHKGKKDQGNGKGVKVLKNKSRGIMGVTSGRE